MTNDLEHELRQHGASLHTLAAALLSDSADAEDAVQDTWLAALERPPKRQGPLGGWLHTVLVSIAAQLQRRRRRMRHREQSLARQASQPGEDAAAIERESLRAVVDAVLGLPEPYRTAIWDRFFTGLSPSAIAERSGESVATVKSRLQRGLSLLRQRMDRGDGARHWRSALSCAFGIPSLTSTSTAPFVLTEVLLMKLGWKLSVAAILLIGGATTLLLLDGDSATVPVAREIGGEQIHELTMVDRLRSDARFDRVPSAVEIAPVPPTPERDFVGGALRGEVLTLADLSAIEGARVSLRIRGSSAVILHATTDTEGRFELEGIPPRPDYEVLVEAHGFAPARKPGLIVHAQTRSALDSFLLAKPFGFAGRVVSAVGAPIAGADVVVFPQVFQYSWTKRAAFLQLAADAVAGGRTDAEGAFVLEGISPGVYHVLASAEGFGTRQLARVAIAPGGSRTIELEQGHVLEIALKAPHAQHARAQSFMLLRDESSTGRGHNPLLTATEPGQAARSDDEGVLRFSGLEEGVYLLVWTPRPGQSITLKQAIAVPASATIAVELASIGVLAGTVLSSEGIALAGARVLAYGFLEQGSAEHEPWIHEVLSDATGAYRLEIPTGGAYSLRASYFGTSGARVEEPPILVRDVVTQLDLHMKPGCIVEGRVTDADSGRPIAGARARIWQAVTSTDAEGRYRLEGVRNESSSFLQVVAPGYWSPMDSLPIQPEGDGALYTPYRLAMANEVTRKDIALHRTGTLLGRVLDSEDGALASARVAVVREDDSDELGAPYEFNSRLAETATNPGGAFVFRELPSHASLRLRVTYPGHQPLVSDPLRVPAGNRKEVVLRMDRERHLQGKVLDDAQGPLSEVLVSLLHTVEGRLRLASSTKTAPDGSFRFRGVPAGELQLHTSKSGFQNARLSLEPLAPGETREGLLLQMEPSFELRGVVVDTSGAPVAHARVTCRSLQSESMRLDQKLTGADGVFAWLQVPSGTYQLSAVHEEVAPKRNAEQVVHHPQSTPHQLVLR
ncbi:MAG: sigma-70 family RNA polymerase sigma factor [Planctomycetes bacterium]|nr:sigma-70 family RNA polymerase sigma factor [Planctomycetota bacterium]